MPLTPIKVRGRKHPSTADGLSKLRGRGRPLKRQTISSASTTDAEAESRNGGDGNPKKRRKTRHVRTLAPLENLPTEILQDIFFRSRNADLMFASKAVMQKLEKSEHVKIEFCFSTLFWPIINGEVDPDLNNRPDPDDDDVEGSLLADAQSRLLSCRFFTVDFFYDYQLKAYEKWNTLHATSRPGRVVSKPVLYCAEKNNQNFDSAIQDYDYILTCGLCHLTTGRLTSEPTGQAILRDGTRAFRWRLKPIAFHPSAQIPVKFFRQCADLEPEDGMDPTDSPLEILGLLRRGPYEILGLLRRGLRLRMPVTGDGFDDLMRDMVRTGNIHIISLMIWFRIFEPTVDTSLPSDMLRILVTEGNCPRPIIQDILASGAHEKIRPSQDDLLDPAIWAWADRNGDTGQWLKQKLKESLDAP
ncbi:hypothetical protein IWZ01DRAFT_185471 [Phyllosticta capitalensis]